MRYIEQQSKILQLKNRGKIWKILPLPHLASQADFQQILQGFSQPSLYSYKNRTHGFEISNCFEVLFIYALCVNMFFKMMNLNI